MSEQLAIHNGEPIIPAGMIKPWPQITDADREAMMEVLAGVLSVTNVVGPVGAIIARMGCVYVT